MELNALFGYHLIMGIGWILQSDNNFKQRYKPIKISVYICVKYSTYCTW